MKTLFRTLISVALLAIASFSFQAKAQDEDDYSFDVERRLNAHGDEFMALAQTTDGRYLIVGTESGKLLVWSIAERRIVKQLDQGSAVHAIVALNDADTFVAAGGPHSGPTNRAVIRKWHIGTGESEEWNGLTDGSVFSLAFDPKSELVVADTFTGKLAVWNSSNGALVGKRSFDGPASGLAINGKEIYRAQISLADEEDEKPNAIVRLRIDQPNRQPAKLTKEEDGEVWGTLRISPDRRFLAARLYKDSHVTVVLRDLAAQKVIATFEARNFEWAANGSLVLFDGEVASARVLIDSKGRVTRTDLLKAADWHGAGSPANVTGQVVSADGAMAWEVFQLGATLVELDLNKKTFDELHSIRGYLFALDVREPLNLFATAGDDGFVRVRKLSDLSLLKEFKAEPGVPQGVALMEDGRHVVFSASSNETPTRISVGDLSSGESHTLFEVPEPYVGVNAAMGGFVYKRGNSLVLAKWTDGSSIREFAIEGELNGYAVSANGEWLVAANEANSLFRFNIKNGSRTQFATNNPNDLNYLAISNDGRYVYSTEFEATLRQWDMQTSLMKEIGSIRGQARTLRLSRDEKEILIGGNHRDVAVYEIESGKRRLYFEIAAADFYVTNVWLGGDRILFSTDAGVLFDGRVKR
ncbi:MAG TPA: WD40 repeat domain-containing protein [Pyrinomonadaceae bacterium]|nr:WD40 repeat domain-containing protein [Pyrinomonadaceae bacterium]